MHKGSSNGCIKCTRYTDRPTHTRFTPLNKEVLSSEIIDIEHFSEKKLSTWTAPIRPWSELWTDCVKWPRFEIISQILFYLHVIQGQSSYVFPWVLVKAKRLHHRNRVIYIKDLVGRPEWIRRNWMFVCVFQSLSVGYKFIPFLLLLVFNHERFESS